MSSYPPKITIALHEIMQKVGYVQKKGKNAFHNYKYAGEKDLLEVLRPAMVEAGLLLIPSVTTQTGCDEFGNTRVTVEYTLAHKDGDVWPEKVIAQGCGNDKNSKGGIGDKGTYKAITGANKYLLFKLFQIETGDDPEEAEEPAPLPVRETSKVPPIKSGASPVETAGEKAEAIAIKALWDKATTFVDFNYVVDDTTERRAKLPKVAQDWFTKEYQRRADLFRERDAA